MGNDKANIITPKFLANYFKIDIEEAKELQPGLERIVYDNNAVIVRAGDAADGLYFIEDGQATVFNDDDEAVNEMLAGQYFGEYAILADEPRLSTVKAHGKVVVYRMKPQDFLDIVGKHPKITGRLLKQVYGQVSTKHTKIVSLTRSYRGVMGVSNGKKDSKMSDIILTYGLTLVCFIAAFLVAGLGNPKGVIWQILPIVFLMAFTLRTKRIVEGMMLTIILLAGMLNRGNFLAGFKELMVEGIGNTDTAETIVIMAMVEVVAALLASAGVVSAFKKLAQKHMKTRTGSMFGMLFIMIAVCLDECLNVVTAGFCMNEAIDRHKVPREMRALLGSFSMAICSLIPFSLWSAYITGWISTYMKHGGNVFIKTIPFNLVGIISLIAAILLCLGIFPKTKQMKKAYARVEKGGRMWPVGSDRFLDPSHEDGVVGKPINLVIPMLVWAVSSVAFGIYNNGEFAMDAVAGLVITIITMFVLYIGQKLMTPKAFFETMADGIENALMPILLLVMAERIAVCLEQLGFDILLEKNIPVIVGGHLSLIPAVLFVLFTFICLGLGSCWGMYGIGIPIAIYLSSRLGIDIALCLGSVFAAGIIGESLCPYLDEASPVVTAIGCAPMPYRRIRIQYWIPMGIICFVGYVILGMVIV